MGSVQQIRVKWNNHQSNFPKVFNNLLHKKEFVDVTLACEGQSIKAHKVVLSACSPYFHTLFLENPCKHPIIIMRDFRYCEIEAVVEYMYKGEVNISRDSLREFLRTAQSLQVRGLADDESGETNSDSVETVDRTYTSQQNRVPDPDEDLRPPSRLSRPGIEQTKISHDAFIHNQRPPVVSHELVQSKTVKRDAFSHTPPKRIRLSEKPVPIHPPSLENVPSSAVSYQSAAEIQHVNNSERSIEVTENPIKIEVKPFEAVGFEETQDSMLDESQDIDQGLDSPETDTILLGDDPEIIEDEPDMQFAHNNSSQEGLSHDGDNFTSNLLSALRDSGAGPSTLSPQQSTGEGLAVARLRKEITSRVWRYFVTIPEDCSRVVCCMCGSVLVKRTAGRTSNLMTHMMHKHKEQYTKMLTEPETEDRHIRRSYF